MQYVLLWSALVLVKLICQALTPWLVVLMAPASVHCPGAQSW